jgi:formylglycine-generating enzyme required for sulfatase activity
MKRIPVGIVALLFLCSTAFAAETSATKSSTRINPKDGAEMVWVPAGEFLMGSTEEDIAALLKAEPLLEPYKEIFDAEKPQRKVGLDGYWMYKYEVTVAQYREFCKETKRKMPEAPSWGWKADHPMVMVTWQDAADYAKWARVSLPTEAQWEKAARGTDGRIYPWGSKWDASKCANTMETELKSTEPVGSYPAGASPYGAMDMAGNVFEWCADWYDPNYYKKAPTKNPTGPSKAVASKVFGMIPIEGARVVRGGSRISGRTVYFRGGFRFDRPGHRCHDFRGFRCARTP